MVWQSPTGNFQIRQPFLKIELCLTAQLQSCAVHAYLGVRNVDVCGAE